MRWARSMAFGLAAAAIALAAAGEARAEPDVVEACVKGYDDAQRLRRDGKLLEAKRSLITCSQAECPTAVRDGCVPWLAEVTSEIPTIALRVVGADGCDHHDAQISIDGADVLDGASGRAIDIDPGPHQVQARLDRATTEQSIVVVRGERQRTVTIAFPGAANAICGGAGPRTTPETTRRPVPKLVPVLIGVGVVGGIVATAFGVSAFNQKSTLDGCKGSCAQSEVDDMQRTFLVADVTAILAVSSLAAAGIVYLLR